MYFCTVMHNARLHVCVHIMHIAFLCTLPLLEDALIDTSYPCWMFIMSWFWHLQPKTALWLAEEPLAAIAVSPGSLCRTAGAQVSARSNTSHRRQIPRPFWHWHWIWTPYTMYTLLSPQTAFHHQRCQTFDLLCVMVYIWEIVLLLPWNFSGLWIEVCGRRNVNLLMISKIK